MKLRKLFIAIIVVIMLSVGVLGGCQDEDAPDVVYVAIINKGYGTRFLEKLIEAYTAKKGKKVEIEWETSLDDRVRTSLMAGPKTNKVDVYFCINDYMVNGILAMGQAVPGYDRLLLDLTDFYDSTPDGFDGKKVSELIDPYYVEGSTFSDGKKYFVPWAIGFSGLIYNVDLFEYYNLEVPRTTDELIALMNQMKTVNNGTYAKNANGDTIYPFVYPGTNDYTQTITNVWRAQHQGINTYYNFLKGQDNNGQYTYQIYGDLAILRSYEVLQEMLYIGTGPSDTNGYVNPNCINAYNFTQAQIKFLEKEAFMMCNGDWVEREAEENFDPGEVNMAFMRVPIISSIVEVLPDKSVTTDEQLCEVIDYIDATLKGEEATRPSYVSDSDLNYIEEARKIICCEGPNHQIFIPSYSNNIEGAKEFMMFSMSREGQEIVLKNSYGNMYPYIVDYSSFDYYDKLTNFQKSKFDIMNEGVIWTGRKSNYPIVYLGGAKVNYIAPESRLGARADAEGTYMTAEDLYYLQYYYYRDNWSNIMLNSGLSN